MSIKSNNAKIEERRKLVAANLLAGLNYREMAELLKCGLATISNDVKILTKRWRAEQVQTIDEWVSLQVKRSDRAINAIWGNVTTGDVQAIDRLLKIIEQQGKLLGYEKLTPHAHLTEADVDVIIENELANLAANRKAQAAGQATAGDAAQPGGPVVSDAGQS